MTSHLFPVPKNAFRNSLIWRHINANISPNSNFLHTKTKQATYKSRIMLKYEKEHRRCRALIKLQEYLQCGGSIFWTPYEPAKRIRLKNSGPFLRCCNLKIIWRVGEAANGCTGCSLTQRLTHLDRWCCTDPLVLCLRLVSTPLGGGGGGLFWRPSLS